MPKPWPRALVCTTSTVEIETTAGATRAARSANEGTVTEVTGPAGVAIVPTAGAGWACDWRMKPRSALIAMPNAIEAIAIAIVERMRLVDEFMGFLAPCCRSYGLVWIRVQRRC